MSDVAARARGSTPVSTYRLQLHPGFTLSDATALVPYLHALGITDCYVSPVSTPRLGSKHGYDVCNHNEVNPELGGESGFRRLATELRAKGMGLMLDFVPNHMGNDPETNEWWRDTLENGPSSPFAHYFDIDWDPIKPELKDRLLLPILGEQYGEALERGALRLRFEDGALVVEYGSHRLPINPRRAPIVYESRIDDLTARLGDKDPHLREFLSILTALRNLPPYTERDPKRIAERTREKDVARDRLGRLVKDCETIRVHVDESVRDFNGVPGEPRSFDRLHGLLEQQAYRLASWRTAADEINYRRFFDINDLAGLRVEDPDVFDVIHRLVLSLIREGLVTGLRLDHIDGLLDPAAYLRRLCDAARDATGDPAPFYVVVEKILSTGETMPREWNTAGTTGYNFLNDLNGIFVDRRNARSLSKIYTRLTGREDPLSDVERDSKRLIIGTALSSEFQVLAAAFNRLSERDRRVRDFTYGTIRRALRAFIACFPVYRTYVSAAGVTAADRASVDSAIAMARLRNPAMEPSIFEFLRMVLLPEPEGSRPHTLPYAQRLTVAMKAQQYTAPVQAKGLEDTAFYRYNVLLSLNEVGGDPARMGLSVEDFHARNSYRRQHWPLEMIATSTHDTKRGEDARARLNVLSELPAEWREAVRGWMRINRALRMPVDGAPAPDRNDEYHFYQALLALWPHEPAGAPLPQRAPASLVTRLTAYMTKAIKEAKLHTSWINPNEKYESAVAAFVERALAGDGAARFLPALVPFARKLSQFGMINSLSQLTLKLASPGVTDFYQGTECWTLTLVDPDNRSEVDYEQRRATLRQLEDTLSAIDVLGSAPLAEPPEAVRTLANQWHDGRIKMFITAAGLRLRRARPRLFLDGTYLPLTVDGGLAEHVVAFARAHGPDVLMAVAPRLLAASPAPARAPGSEWRDTRLRLPSEWRDRVFRSVLTGEAVKPVRTAHESWLMLSQLLNTLPTALLWSAE